MTKMTRLATLLSLVGITVAANSNSNSSCPATALHLPDPPYDNYFFSDCHVDAQAVVTSPLPDSNLTIIGPRLIIAWPGGNSGVCAFFAPQNGQNGSLAIELVNSTLASPLSSAFATQNASSAIPTTGVEGVLSFNDSATLSLAILGSVRTIRDFVEGPSLLVPVIQDAVTVQRFNGTGAQISRLWLDNVTTTTLTLSPWRNTDAQVHVDNKTVSFGAGFYRFSATYNYPQLKQLKPSEILRNESLSLAKTQSEQVEALSFFSYSDKLLAGGWRFLTYFGRDSMIFALLTQPILKTGAGSAMEAVLGAALERINKTDGTVAHEETIGDYATYTNRQNGILNSTAAGFTYQMIDTDYYLPVLMDRYFQASPDRVKPLLQTAAGEVNVANKNMTWGDLGHRLASKIMNMTAAFEKEQTASNLIHLLDGVPVGQWRDSEHGLANGRIPFDVNCALVPAALRAIASLSTMPGVFPDSDAQTLQAAAAKRADIWQNSTLALFRYSDSVTNGTALLDNYAKDNTVYHGPTHGDSLAQYSCNGSIVDYGLALPSDNDLAPIRIMHTDTAFRNVLLFNATGDDDAQLTEYVNATANAVLRPFPAGLTTPFGAVVANPALSGDATLVANFTNSAYHGTVVWGWQLALVAKGFELQLGRCGNTTSQAGRAVAKVPAFCSDGSVHGALKAAYNRIWDVIEANQGTLQSEVWSWTYANSTAGNATGSSNSTASNSTGSSNSTAGNATGSSSSTDGSSSTTTSSSTGSDGNSANGDGFTFSPLGVLPPPPGVAGGTESNVRQLWSLVFLAMSRDAQYKN